MVEVEVYPSSPWVASPARALVRQAESIIWVLSESKSPVLLCVAKLQWFIVGLLTFPTNPHTNIIPSHSPHHLHAREKKWVHCALVSGWCALSSSIYSSLRHSDISHLSDLHINYWTNGLWLLAVAVFSTLSPSVIWMTDSSVFSFILASLKLIVLQLWLCAVSLEPATLWIRAASNSIYNVF